MTANVKPLPTKPSEPAVGMPVLVNLGTLESPRWRAGTVTEVWPGEFGAKKPAGINVTIFVSGLNDRQAIEAHFIAEGSHRDNAANQALAICSRLLWHLTSRPYGAAHADWKHGNSRDEELDVEALLAAPLQDRVAWAKSHPWAVDWRKQKDVVDPIMADPKALRAQIEAEEDAKVPPPSVSAADPSVAHLKADGPQELEVAFDGPPEKAPADVAPADVAPAEPPAPTEEPASDAPAVSDANGNPVIP